MDSLFDVELEWAIDTKGFRYVGPDINLNSVQKVFSLDQRIVRNGGKLEKRQAGRLPKLLLKFASVRTPQDLLNFYAVFGPLTLEGFSSEHGDQFKDADGQFLFTSEEGEDLSVGLDRAEWFRSAIAAKDKPAEAAKRVVALTREKYEMQFLPHPKRGIRMVFRPTSLADLLTIQLVHLLMTGPAYGLCRHCGEFFAKGVGTLRRMDAQFCCDPHRVQFNSRRRTKISG